MVCFLFSRAFPWGGPPFGNATRAFAALEFRPDIFGRNTGINPHDDQVVQHVSAFTDQFLAVTVDSFDQAFDGFLTKFLGNLVATAGHQACGVAEGRISAAAGLDRVIQALENQFLLKVGLFVVLLLRRLRSRFGGGFSHGFTLQA